MTNEFPLSYFLDLAYDYETYGKLDNSLAVYTEKWVSRQFPTLTDKQRSEIVYIINTYTKLAHTRRTESLQPDTYHPVNYGESDSVLKNAEDVILRAEKLREEIPEDVLPGFFMQVFFPAVGNMNVLRMQLYSGKNRWFAKHGAIAANWYAKKVKQCYEYDQKLVNEVDEIDNGKFYASGWSEHFGFKNWCEAESRYPTYTFVEPTRKGRNVFWVEGSEKTTSGQDWTDRVLKYDGFRNPETTQFKLYIANCGKTGTPYVASFANEKTPADLFLTAKIEKAQPCDENGVPQIDEVVVSIDREKLSKSSVKKDTLIIEANDGRGAGIKVFVEIDAEPVNVDYPKGTFVQTTNHISIEAEHFVASGASSSGAKWEILPAYGKTLSAVKAYPVTVTYPKGKNAPYVEYKFALESSGVMNFDFYLNPSNPAYKDNTLQFIAEVNGQKILHDVVDPSEFVVGDNKEPWSTDVTNNIRVSTIYADCKEGLNSIKVYPVTPNIVLEKIVIYAANAILPDSYLGAPETFRIK